MDTNTVATAPVEQNRVAVGTLRICESVVLKKQDNTDYTMGVLWIEAADGSLERYTDFGNMHKALELDQPIRAIYKERTVGQDTDYPEVKRNVIALSQPKD